MLARRYKQYVPHALRVLIAERRLPRPNWFIGAAEQPLMPRDPALTAEIDAVTARIDERRDRGETGRVATDRPHAPSATR